MRRLTLVFGSLAWLATLAVCPDGRTDELRQRYVEGLRQQGLADLAIEYLELALKQQNLSQDDRSDIEFEIAASYISASDALGDLSKRDQMLETARTRFDTFSKSHPTHPRRSESLFHMGMIDLQQGRLRVAQAQLPANSTRVPGLANEARQYLSNAAENYQKAFEQAQAAYKKLPVYIDDERPDSGKLHREKSRLFGHMIEARFQGALARFYLADSFQSIPLPEPTDPSDKSAAEAIAKTKADWGMAYHQAMAAAEKGFEQIYLEHRREAAGLFGHLWMARCMAARGDHRKAMGIFTQLMEHDNRELARFQRDVFYFTILSHMARKEHDQVIALSEPWLRRNTAAARELCCRGVELELARAYIAKGLAATDDKSKLRYFVDANQLLERLAGSADEFQGLARREQMQIAGFLTQGDRYRNFNQLLSLANGKLDELKPGLAAEKRATMLREAQELLHQAIKTARPEDPVNDARLALVFAMIHSGETYEAAVLAEHIARAYPKSAAAPQAASLGVTALAYAYDQAFNLKQQGFASDPDTDIRHLIALVTLLKERWPDSKETDEAILTVGGLELSRQRYPEATAALQQVGTRSVKYPEAASLAGRAYWDWFLSLARREGSDTKQLGELRDKAKALLQAASPQLKQNAAGKLTYEVLLNEAAIAEVLYELNDPDAALAAIGPLVQAIDKDACPAEAEPPLRIRVLTTALQCYIRQGKLEEADNLVALIVRQKGQEKAGNVTLVLVSLANRLKEQIERIRASGDAARLEQTAAAFEKFLDNIASREAGQNVQSLVFLGNSFVELGRHAKAVALFERALAHPDASKKENEGSILFARLLAARSFRLSGDYAQARKAIDELYKSHRSHLPILMERGEILEAAGDHEAAIRHYKDAINRMQRSRPRPEEFYKAMDRLLKIFLDLRDDGRTKRLKEGYKYAQFLVRVDETIPGNWKTVFESHVGSIGAELGIPPEGN